MLPLCAVLFPMMWTLLDASGLARFIVLFPNTISVPGMLTCAETAYVYPVCCASLGAGCAAALRRPLPHDVDPTRCLRSRSLHRVLGMLTCAETAYVYPVCYASLGAGCAASLRRPLPHDVDPTRCLWSRSLHRPFPQHYLCSWDANER